jgi:hypothetical protein
VGSLVEAVLGFERITDEVAIKLALPVFVEVGPPGDLALARLQYTSERKVAALMGTTTAEVQSFVPSGTVAVRTSAIDQDNPTKGRYLIPSMDLAPGAYAWVPSAVLKIPASAMSIALETHDGKEAGRLFVFDPLDTRIRLGLELARAGMVAEAHRLWAASTKALLTSPWRDTLRAALPPPSFEATWKWARTNDPGVHKEIEGVLQQWTMAFNAADFKSALQRYRPKGRSVEAGELKAVIAQLADLKKRCGSLVSHTVVGAKTVEDGIVVTVQANYDSCPKQIEVTRFVPQGDDWAIDGFLDND